MATRKKTATKKKVARKPAKKTVRKTVKKPAKKAVRKTVKKAVTTPIKKAHTKSEILNYIAERTELGKKDVAGVFEALGEIMHRHLCKRSVGEFTVPGLMKCRVQRKPATKARKGINPFTKEEMMFKAKPARNVVKVRPLKKLKEMAEK